MEVSGLGVKSRHPGKDGDLKGEVVWVVKVLGFGSHVSDSTSGHQC